MTRYEWDSKRKRLVAIGKIPRAQAPLIRVERMDGPDGQGVRCRILPRTHPAIAASGLARDARGWPVVGSRADRERLMAAYNQHEEGRSGKTLVWTKESPDDETVPDDSGRDD